MRSPELSSSLLGGFSFLCALQVTKSCGHLCLAWPGAPRGQIEDRYRLLMTSRVADSILSTCSAQRPSSQLLSVPLTDSSCRHQWWLWLGSV